MLIFTQKTIIIGELTPLYLFNLKENLEEDKSKKYKSRLDLVLPNISN